MQFLDFHFGTVEGSMGDQTSARFILDVDGSGEKSKEFVIPISALRNHKDSFFETLFSGRWDKKEGEAIRLQRDPEMFENFYHVPTGSNEKPRT